MSSDHLQAQAAEQHRIWTLQLNEYRRTGHTAVLDAAVQQFQKAIDAIPSDDPNRPAYLQSLAIGYSDRFRRLGDIRDLDQSIQLDQEAVEKTAVSDPDRAKYLQSLSVDYGDRFQRLGDLKDLDYSIQLDQEAVDITAPEDPDRPGRLQNLAIGYRDRFQRLGNIQDLNRSIQLNEEAAGITLFNDPDRADLLHNLAVNYNDRFRRLGDIQDLESAIKLDQDAVDITALSDPDRPERLQSLAISYSDRFQRLGNIKDLEYSIKIGEEMIRATASNHPDRAGRLHSLAIDYSNRFKRLELLQDLDYSMKLHQEALDATESNNPNRASRLQGLAISYRHRFQRLGNIQDLNDAIRLRQEAVDSTPSDNPQRPGRLRGLATSYNDRFRKLGDLEDLEIAIRLGQEAMDGTPKDSPRYIERLQSLAIDFSDRFQRLGSLQDLDLSIQLKQQALDGTPTDNPDRLRQLQCLAIGYRERFQRLGALKDSEFSMQLNKEAVNITPADSPHRAGRLRNLAVDYSDRFQRQGALEDLNYSIQLKQEALDCTPSDDPNRPRRLHSLSISYRDRFRKLGNLQDLDRSIQLDHEAVDSTTDDMDRARRVHSLAIGYSDRFEKLGNLQDLDRSIQLDEEVVHKTSPDHPEQAQRLHRLAISYENRFQELSAPEDLDHAIHYYQSALDSKSSPALDRIHYSSDLMHLYSKAENWSQAYQVASVTASLIPSITQRSLENSDKQHRLANIVGLASDVAAVALKVGASVYDAIHLQELCRGIIAASLNEMRLDISDLRQQYPDLAKAYLELCSQLDSSTLSPYENDHQDVSAISSPQIEQRYKIGQELDQIIEKIRGQPGFGRFLLPPTEDDMRMAAVLGPIVVINASRYRCDALIVQNDGLRVLELHNLHSEDIRKYAANLDSGSVTTQLLEWLWDAIAGPVLEALGYTETPGGRWPRMWWILTGPLAKFPIHSSGYHDAGSDSVLDRVISSYSSSIKTLIHSRRNRPKMSTRATSTKAVLVGMQHTPGQMNLPFASQEISKLESICAHMQIEVRKPQPNLADVLSALDDCQIFHFAGHGETNSSDPLQSAIVLENERLTVANLLETNLYSQKPFLAYLSACSTGRMKNSNLIDEGLHLIAACQLAGFQHVIGTLWEVRDESCVNIATRTYKQLQEHGISDQSIGEGLHYACRTLRSEWVTENRARTDFERSALQFGSQDQASNGKLDPSQGETRNLRDAIACEDLPLYWVPYVHFGV